MKHIYTEPHFPYSQVHADEAATQPMIDLALNLVDLLPHGSGIDCTWNVTAYANKVECANELHAMDSDGYYAGYYPFTVEFTAEDLPRIAADKYYVSECVNWTVDEVYEENEEKINPWNAEDEDEDEDQGDDN